jgi:ABC-type polysaccharide transport system permease subunit
MRTELMTDDGGKERWQMRWHMTVEKITPVVVVLAAHMSTGR